jgi:hypothetical protein
MSHADYPPAVAELLAGAGPMPLGAGTPDRAATTRLRPLDVSSLFAPAAVRDADMARACLAGLWLRFNDLDESHRICQDIHTPEGSFWHAIMHRREPDAANSKYWFRRVDRHPVIEALREQAPALGHDYTSPAGFVDFCERVRDTDTPEEAVAKQVQLLEWQLLFEHCRRRAIA